MDDQTTQQAATVFADAARRYVALIDSRGALVADRLLLDIHPLLCELAYRASMLPDLEWEGGFIEDPMTSDQWYALFESLGEALGGLDGYWEVFDPVAPSDEDPITRDLSDDLADVYRDVSVGLDSVGEHIPDAVIGTWRFSFRSHWGMHAISAMRVIQTRIAYHELDGD